jgi:hypothetical protein
MNTPLESAIKWTVLSILVLAGILFWILPKTRFSRHILMNEKLFLVSQLIGMGTGVAGLAATFIWPGLMVESHLMWALILPFVLIQFYWGLIVRIRKTAVIVDEKQSYDMTLSGALTMAFSIPAMAVMFVLYYNHIVEGALWFPFYLFISVLSFSTGILISFKKS